MSFIQCLDLDIKARFAYKNIVVKAQSSIVCGYKGHIWVFKGSKDIVLKAQSAIQCLVVIQRLGLNL